MPPGKPVLDSVAKGPQFRPKKFLWDRENLKPNFWQIYQKGAERFCSLILN
jgi:hypothetical protein